MAARSGSVRQGARLAASGARAARETVRLGAIGAALPVATATTLAHRLPVLAGLSPAPALWQAAEMPGFGYQGTNGFGWTELNARGVERTIPFYQQVFGWGHRASDMGEGRTYHEFLDGDESLAGAWEMSPQIPPQVPSYWLVYFAVDDVAATHDRAVTAGATSAMAATEFPGGQFAILFDPQGGMFGLLTMGG